MSWLKYIGLCVLISACAVSPLGRKQLLLVSDGQMDQMGVAAYADMKQQQPLSHNDNEIAYVNCLASNIIAVLGADEAGKWEVNVFQTDVPNAFALPGKKIGVNTGMFRVADNQDQLAAVMGHEVGHVLAKHSAERISIQLASQAGLQIAGALAENSKEKQQIMGLLGMGAQFGITLPFSRKHETEADLMGLDLMARAGFDPRQSVVLWQNMGKLSAGNAPPEWLSTHPASSSRIENLSARMPHAMALYQQALKEGKNPQCRL